MEHETFHCGAFEPELLGKFREGVQVRDTPRQRPDKNPAQAVVQLVNSHQLCLNTLTYIIPPFYLLKYPLRELKSSHSIPIHSENIFIFIQTLVLDRVSSFYQTNNKFLDPKKQVVKIGSRKMPEVGSLSNPFCILKKDSLMKRHFSYFN